MDESAPWNLGVLRVPYITTKREGEQVALASSGRGMDVVAVNPGCVIGPDDFSGSEFGILCKRFWRGRVPVYFAGGMNFVDVRDVAAGVLLAARHGEAGTRYLLGGHNLTLGEFFAALAQAADRWLPRVRMPLVAARIGARLASAVGGKKNSRPYLSPAQARLLGRYFWYDSTRACRLGYTIRPLTDTIAAAHTFWMSRRAA
jgi:dihydroflavonol-4-reductase